MRDSPRNHNYHVVIELLGGRMIECGGCNNRDFLEYDKNYLQSSHVSETRKSIKDYGRI